MVPSTQITEKAAVSIGSTTPLVDLKARKRIKVIRKKVIGISLIISDTIKKEISFIINGSPPKYNFSGISSSIIFSLIFLATVCLSAPSSKVKMIKVEVPSSDTIVPLYISFENTLSFKASNSAFESGKSYSSSNVPISIPHSLPFISSTLVRLVIVEIPSNTLNVSVICLTYSITSFLKTLSVSIIIIPISLPPNSLPMFLYRSAAGSSSGNELIMSELIFRSLI